LRYILAVLVVGLSVLLTGCGEGQPTSVGGKSVDHWVRALHDPDARLRKRAATKLGNAGAADATVVPALIEALKDREASVRAEAVLALLRIGPAAHEAAPALQQAASNDRDPTVRAFAGKALAKVSAEAP
jgi:HEAT repeat protein